MYTEEKLFDYYGDKDSVSVMYNEETMRLVIDRVFKYMQENNCFFGESLHQDDDCIIDAPNVLSDIIDNILKPKFINED